MIAANLGLLVTMVALGSLIPVLNHLLPTWDPYFLSAARYALAAPIFVLLLLVLEPRSRAVRAVASWRVWLLGAVFGGAAILAKISPSWLSTLIALFMLAAGIWFWRQLEKVPVEKVVIGASNVRVRGYHRQAE